MHRRQTGTSRDRTSNFQFQSCRRGAWKLDAIIPTEHTSKLNKLKLINSLQTHQISEVTGEISSLPPTYNKERKTNIVDHSDHSSNSRPETSMGTSTR